MRKSFRQRYTAEQRSQWVERYLHSGLTQREFAANHKLSVSNLQRWAAQAPGRGPCFAEVTLPAGPSSEGWTAEIVRPNGATLRCTNAIAPELLQQLLRPC